MFDLSTPFIPACCGIILAFAGFQKKRRKNRTYDNTAWSDQRPIVLRWKTDRLNRSRDGDRVEQSYNRHVTVVIISVELPVGMNFYIHQIESFIADGRIDVGNNLQRLEIRLRP